MKPDKKFSIKFDYRNIKEYFIGEKNYVPNFGEEKNITKAQEVPRKHKVIINFIENTIQLTGPKCKQGPVKIDLTKWNESKNNWRETLIQRNIKARTNSKNQKRNKKGQFT